MYDDPIRRRYGEIGMMEWVIAIEFLVNESERLDDVSIAEVLHFVDEMGRDFRQLH